MIALGLLVLILAALLYYCSQKKEFFNVKPKDTAPNLWVKNKDFLEPELKYVQPLGAKSLEMYENKLIMNEDANQWVKDHPYGEGALKYKTFLSANKYTFWDSHGSISHNKSPSLRSDPTIPKK